MKVKYFLNKNLTSLQSAVNLFLKNEVGNLHNHKFTAEDEYLTAVLYQEKSDNDKNQFILQVSYLANKKLDALENAVNNLIKAIPSESTYSIEFLAKDEYLASIVYYEKKEEVLENGRY